MQHSVPEKMAPTLPKFLAEERERVPRSLNPVEGEGGVSLFFWYLEEWGNGMGERGEGRGGSGTNLVLSAVVVGEIVWLLQLGLWIEACRRTSRP